MKLGCSSTVQTVRWREENLAAISGSAKDILIALGDRDVRYAPIRIPASSFERVNGMRVADFPSNPLHPPYQGDRNMPN
jgi:hypothetical protein